MFVMKSYEQHLIGTNSKNVPKSNQNEVDWDDPKISYVTNRCRGKTVLDLGCVQHDPAWENSKRWLHKAIKLVAKDVTGLDLYKPGVDTLVQKGYNIVHGNAEHFVFDKAFDVIVAGDLIEHLSNFGNFLESCVSHMSTESKLIICTPNPWHWHRVLRATFKDVPVNGEHTCWLCPTTLKQLAKRYNLRVQHFEYGSSRFRDKFLPLPKRLRHQSWQAELQLVQTKMSRHN